MPGAFEGETVTRRRFMTLTAHGAGAVAASAFTAARARLRRRLGALRAARGAVGGGRRARGLPRRHLRPEGHHRGLAASARSARPPSTCARATRRSTGPSTPTSRGRASSSRSPRAACTSAARSATSRPRRASSARATAASTTSRGARLRRPAGAPARPLLRARRNGQVEVGPRYSVNSEFKRFPSYRDPGQDLDGIGQYMYPGRFSTPKLD